MSEKDRIRATMQAAQELDNVGCLFEQSHYRANGPTRSMVHWIAGTWGIKAQTRLEAVEGGWLLWFKLIPQTEREDLEYLVRNLRRTEEGLIYSTTRRQAQLLTAVVDNWLAHKEIERA